MEYLYVLCEGDWEDMVVLTDEATARVYSTHHPTVRIERFRRTADHRYEPSYSFYLAGVLYPPA
jgi:hypothetical protein